METDEQVGEELNGEGGELVGLGAQRAGNRGHTYRNIDRYTRKGKPNPEFLVFVLG